MKKKFKHAIFNLLQGIEKSSGNVTELCIRCGKPTPYDINYPVDKRKYYIDGSGQLCPLCYQELYGMAPSLGVPVGAGLPQTSDEKRTDYSK